MMMERFADSKNYGPLKGLTVLELGSTIAGPLAGCFLGDFGAEIVKIEHPLYIDSLRSWPPMKEGKSLWWKVTSRNKKLITLDLSKPMGQKLFRTMVPMFDVIIENFRPGTMERWNLSYEELQNINPRIILVRISGYGQTGPKASRPGYGTIAEAMSGIPSFTGFPDKPPTLSAFPLADSIVSIFATSAILMAIYERDVHGSCEGQVIDMGLYEPMIRLVESQVIGYDQLGVIKSRTGNRMEEASPRNTYKTLDGKYIVISASSDRTFSRLARAIGHPEIIDDPRFCSNQNRVENNEELDEIIASWFEQKTLTEAMNQMEDFDVVAGYIYDIVDIFNDPHIAARENIISVQDKDFGSVRMQGVVPKFSRTPGCVSHSGGDVGEDNDEFYSEILGLSQNDIDEFRKNKII